MRRTTLMLLFVGLLGPWACKADDASTTPSPHSQWGYSGEQAPEHWAELDEDFHLQVTNEHIEAFREIYRANARPLQPRANWCLLPDPPE